MFMLRDSHFRPCGGQSDGQTLQNSMVCVDGVMTAHSVSSSPNAQVHKTLECTAPTVIYSVVCVLHFDFRHYKSSEWNFSFQVGDAGKTSLVDASTALGATAVVTPGSAGYLLWECCILASL